ncbi:hypothetical protein DSECCO2_451010 [anaerobic digester metagenome]|jgi:hypothetical protein
MASAYLSKISDDDRNQLVMKLWQTQGGKCFICDDVIDLAIHKNSIDIDHVEPSSAGGKDDESNFALTHSSCNRSKQASNLRVARVLANFAKTKTECQSENRNPNLGDILKKFGGSKYSMNFSLIEDQIKYSFEKIGDVSIKSSPVYHDNLSGMKYFFAKLPIEYLFHDDKINPRPIGNNISGLIEEFFKKRPQLHVSLGWIDCRDDYLNSSVKIFDGQHKAAAQILLGVRSLPVRIFINPDMDVLLTTNTNAGTTLRQIAFDKSVRRHLGHTLYFDRIQRYQKERELSPEDYSFSEKDLMKHFKGESREIKKYVLDAVRNGITGSQDNKLIDYIDFGGRAKEKPLSYSTIEKTFYSFFIFQELLDTSLDYQMDVDENPRELEKKQIIHLMNIIANEIYINKFDTELGTSRIENKIQKGELVPEDHLRAYRLSKEEIMYTWLKYVLQIVRNYFLNVGYPINEEKVFQYPFPDQIWKNVESFVKNLVKMPVWVNTDLSLSVFGGKQNYEYWQTIFQTGKSPTGQQVLPSGINIMEMIRGDTNHR